LQLPKEFYAKELKTREKYNYPPYSFVIKLSFAENLNEKSSLEATKTYQLLLKLTKNEPSIKIYSPVSANPAYYKNKYWTVIIVKIIEKDPWIIAKKIINHIPSGCKVDLNPENLLNQS
jgi:primosomal protein N'